MSLRWTRRWLMGMALVLVAAPAPRAQEKVPVAQDLTAVIALQGLPCGKVVKVDRQAENDYLASCSDGNRYRVFVSAEGRVVVEKR